MRARLLHDEAELQGYLDAFPTAAYQVKTIPGLGRFYLDDLDDLIKNHLREGKLWEPHIRELLRRHVRPDTAVIDAGAHIGTHALLMSELVGPSGRVYAFEPQRKIYRELHQNLRLNRTNNVVPLRFALGDRNQVIRMAPARTGNEGGTGIGSGGDPVELRTIDSFAFCNVSLLKVDVESYEDPVLAGAAELLRTQAPSVIVEIMGGHHPATAPPRVVQRIAGTLRRLYDYGYWVQRVTDHDYFAFAAEAGATCTAGRCDKNAWSLPVTDALFRTDPEAAQRTSHGIQSTGRAGTVLFGPYVALPPGAYAVAWRGVVQTGGAAHVDVASGLATKTHARLASTLQAASSSQDLVILAFTLERPVFDVEFRLLVDEGVHLTVHDVELRSLQPGS